MKIGLVSSCMPMVNGGARFIVDWLETQLLMRGHSVEKIYLPSHDHPATCLEEMASFAAIDLGDQFDRVVTFRPPSHLIRHPKKVVWFIHHIRIFYDLWDHYWPFPKNDYWQAMRQQVFRIDTNALRSAHRIFTNSQVVSRRLKSFNDVDADVLYPPVMQPERFRSGDYGDEIVSVCRIEPHKRQDLLVKAMAHTSTPVRLRLCGLGMSPQYVAELSDIARQLGVAERVTIDNRWITEEEKAAYLETALASAYVPFDEDSYGYPTIEAAHARRSTVTVSDSGGVPEFVQTGLTGLIAEPDPQAVGEAFDRLYADKALAATMGAAAADRVQALGIDWDNVVEKLLA